MGELYKENALEQNLVLGPVRGLLILGAAMGMLAVLLGAFGAHGLEKAVEEGRLRAELLESWHTAVEYQYYHVFALLFCCLFAAIKPAGTKLLKRSGWFFVIGIALFSGSLYLMTVADLMGTKWAFLGPITPIGGLLLAIGWGNLLYYFLTGIKKS